MSSPPHIFSLLYLDRHPELGLAPVVRPGPHPLLADTLPGAGGSLNLWRGKEGTLCASPWPASNCSCTFKRRVEWSRCAFGF
jgi:hypothetical protein